MSERRAFRGPGAGGDPQAVMRPGPDVSAVELAGAGYVAMAIETDRWTLARRESRGYRENALTIAEGLGFELEQPSPSSRPSPFGGMMAVPLPENVAPPAAETRSMEARELEVILKARRADPAAFEGVPVTNEEIRRAVTADLKGQWEDARRTLDLAPGGLFGGAISEFGGRLGAMATDEVNLPLAVLTAPIGASATLGRMMLMGGTIGVAAEGLTLPKQYRMAERLDIPEPNAPAQLAMGAVAGAVLPPAFAGALRAGRAGAGLVRRRISNPELVRRHRERASELSPEQRAAVDRLEAAEAARIVNPAANPAEAARASDQALADMELGRPPEAGPTVDPARATDLTTPQSPDTPGVEVEPGIGRAATRAAEPPDLVGNLQTAIRDAESTAAGGYDAPSSYTVVAPPRPLTQMTLDELDAWQGANIAAGAKSTAAGGYQVIRDTLRGVRKEMGLSGSEIFTPGLQDRIGKALLERRGLLDFRAGRITADQFADNLAQEWAALPLITGRSYYAGDMLNAATIDRETIIGILGGQSYTQTGKPPPVMTRFPAAGLEVDARTYQFRTEVNEEGVGQALDRVRVWDELLAGDVIVHERLDGRRYIADGHHRRQLANRLEADGHAPIAFNGFILREADGYTVEDVRAIAAIKNIEAGNARAVDAAKVLRVDPTMLERLSLRQSHVRDARGLMRLDDESFDMVTNGQVAESHAAIVGEMTADPAMQQAVMRTLIQAKPNSLAEARQVAADAHRLGIERGRQGGQGSLFGDDWNVGETLFRERAKVMAKALAQLRADRKVFATLVRENDRITGAGNVLTTEANRGRAELDDAALALIERLVNRAGPLDDALTEAARSVRGGGSVTDASRGFVESVRGEIEAGGLHRLLDGRDGSAGDAAQTGARAGKGGDDAADAGSRRDAGRGSGEELGAASASERTEAGDQLVTPGTRPVTDADRMAAAADAPMRGRTVAADDGLFDMGARDQSDMFDDPSPDAPGPRAQADAAEDDLRAALAAGEDLEIPTGREIDGEAELMSLRAVLEDLDADTEFMGVLNVCK